MLNLPVLPALSYRSPRFYGNIANALSPTHDGKAIDFTLLFYSILFRYLSNNFCFHRPLLSHCLLIIIIPPPLHHQYICATSIPIHGPLKFCCMVHQGAMNTNLGTTALVFHHDSGCVLVIEL